MGIPCDKSPRTSDTERQTDRQQIARRASARTQEGIEAITAELGSALAREAELRREKDTLLQRQDLLTQEFEHRLVNGLQLVVSLLSLQSQKTESAEAAAQLKIAAKRVAAFGRVHRRLHLLDCRETVELKQYIQALCQDISELLFDGNVPHSVVVEGAEIEIPTKLGIPLGFIVNELITNAAKHAAGEITVRLETTPELGHCLAVSNDGPSLPDGFHPGGSRGLGLKIIQALASGIDGRLHIGQGQDQRGACFKVFFPLPASPAGDRAAERSRTRANGISAGNGLLAEPA